MNYNFTLKDNNEKAYRLFIWFLFFLHVVAAGIFALYATDKNVRLSIYILLGFYALISSVYFFLRKRKKAFEMFSLIMALLYANFWLKHVGVIALFIFIALFLFVTVVQRKKVTILFSDKDIRVSGVLKTIIYPWAELEHVILKDGLLSINFKSDKLIQCEIAEQSEVINEIEFNRFCAVQLQNIV